MKPMVIRRDGNKAPVDLDRIQAVIEAAAELLDKNTASYTLNVALAVDGIGEIEPQKLNIFFLIALLIALSLDIDATFRCDYVSNVTSKLCIERPNNRSPPQITTYLPFIA